MRDLDLLMHRQRLVLRSQQLRTALARDARTLARPLQHIDAAGTALARYAHGPALPFAALLGLLLAWRMRGGMRTVLRVWGLWRGWQTLRRWLQE